RTPERRASRRRIGCGGRRAGTDQVDGRRRQEASAAQIARRGSDAAAAWVVDNSVSATDDHLLRDLPRKPQTRCDVVAVRIALIPRSAVATNEPDDALSSGQWIGGVGIEERELVILLDPWALVFVPQADVHGEGIRDSPIVLNVRGHVGLRRAEPRVAGDLAARRRAQQKRREFKTGCRC